MAYPHQHLMFDDTSGEAQVALREAATTPPNSADTSETSTSGASTSETIDSSPAVDGSAAADGSATEPSSRTNDRKP